MQNDQQNSTQANIYNKTIAILHYFYVDLRRNILILLGCIIIITALLIFSNLKKGNSYNSSFTVVYEDLVRKVYGDRIEKLDQLLANNTTKAQHMLGLDSKTMESLEEVRGTNILGEKLSEDLNVDKIPFIVHIKVSDTSNVTKIQNAILNYLETGNAYLLNKRTLRMQEINDELAFIEQQLGMMDSLKRKYYNASGSSEKSNASESSVYQISYDLYKKKQELKKKLEMPQNLYVIDDAIVPTKNNKSYFLIGAVGIAAGFICYLFIVYLILPVIRYKPVS